MTPSQRLFDNLLQIPLFLGMGESDLLEIATRTRFDFHKSEPGKRLQREGQLCDRLTMVLSGTVSLTERANGNEYSVTEDINAPYVIEPERLFGIKNRYAKTVTAKSMCNTVTLAKSEVTRLLNSYSVFRLNLLNLISTNMQRELRQKWSIEPKPLRERIVKFFITRCAYPAGTKHFNIKMTRLATELNTSRRAVSATLNQMQDERLITLRRAGIDIPLLERLHDFPAEKHKGDTD